MRKDVALEDIEPVLDYAEARSLEMVMRVTRRERRVRVALAFADLSVQAWSHRAGLEPVSVGRWLAPEHPRMPLGAAYRLSAVLGVDIMPLFSWWME